MPITSTAFKPGNDYGKGRPSGVPNLRSQENHLRWLAKAYIDPLDFYGQVISDPNLPVETRLAAGNLATPYLHSKLGAIPIPADPTFMEIKLKNPDPSSIDHCVENITLLTKAKASGECSIEHADSLIADQKVILYAMLDQQKQTTAEGGPPQQTIKIEGGLPRLPGTNIDMPPPASAMNGHAVDGPPTDDHTGPQPSNDEP
jgi:hypothetical protein